MPVITSEYPKWITVNDEQILCQDEAEEKEKLSKQKKKPGPKSKKVESDDNSSNDS